MISGVLPWVNTHLLMQEAQGIRSDVHCAVFSGFGSSDIDPCRDGVLHIPSDGYSPGFKVDVGPLESAALSAPHSGVRKQVYVCPPATTSISEQTSGCDSSALNTVSSVFAGSHRSRNSNSCKATLRKNKVCNGLPNMVKYINVYKAHVDVDKGNGLL